MKPHIHQMISKGRIGIEQPVDEKRGIQDWANHMIQMTDKGFPVFQMRIVDYRGKVIKLKNTQKGIAVNHEGNRQEPEH